MSGSCGIVSSWLLQISAISSPVRAERSTYRAVSGKGATSVVALERQMRHAFRGEAHRFFQSDYLADYESDLTHRSALMRHIGAPTRILVWSLSPYVALYFAVEDSWDDPGALWCVRRKSIDQMFAAKYPKTYKQIWREERKRAKHNPFMNAE